MPLPPEVIVGGDAAYQLQKAVYAILSVGAGVPVYDGIVPDSLNDGAGVKFPYIILGEELGQPADRLTTTADNIVFNVSAFSNYPGTSEVKQLSNTIKLLLNHRGGILPLQGWVCNMLRSDFTQVFTEADGIHRAILRFRAILQPLR